MEEIVGTVILLGLICLGVMIVEASLAAAQRQIHVAQYEEAAKYCPGSESCNGNVPKMVDGRYCRPLVVGQVVVHSVAICDITPP